jgi:hypothetical protein
MVTLMCEGEQWRLRTDSIEHRPLRQSELKRFVAEAGFVKIRTYGNYQQERFSKQSDLLLMVANKAQ